MPAAAGTAFARAAALSADPAVRASRRLLAAESTLQAGATERAAALASEVDADLLPPPDRGRPALVRGRAAMLLGRPGEAGPLLLAAAGSLVSPWQAAALAEAVEAALESADTDFARLLVERAERVRPDHADLVLQLHLGRARSALQYSRGGGTTSGRALRRSIEALGDSGGDIDPAG